MEFLQAVIGGKAPSLSLDTGIILFIFITGFLYGMRVRKKRLILFIVSFYGSIALLSVFPFAGVLAERFSAVGVEGVSFVLLAFFLMAIYFVLAGSTLKIYLPIPKWRREQFWHIAVLSFATSGFMVSIALSLFPGLFKVGISPVTEQFFLTDTARLLWLFAPLIAIRLVARYKK